jgi:iron complex transport system substrate-binding protein
MIVLLTAALATEPPARPEPRFPVTIENCGVRQTFTAPPRRAVTMNQAATEVMLALGLGNRLVGTAYRDDEILPELAAAYRAVPVLAPEYPSREVLLAAKPDFVYGSFATAFSVDVAGTRPDLSGANIATYLSPSACPRGPAARGSLESGFDEMRDLARIFGVSARADTLIAGYEAELARVKRALDPARAPRIFWYDANDPPSAGACCGAPDLVIRLLGGRNVFSDLPGSWAAVSWETVVARDPEVIVLIDATWSSAAEKRRLLSSTPAYARIDAVRHQRLATVPFSFGLPGIRTVAAVRRIAEQLWPERLR